MEKKTKISLLAIQIGSEIANVEANISKVEHLLEENLSYKRADFVFLPEVWTSGWDCVSFPHCAEEIGDAKSVNMLKRIAKKYQVNIIGGSIIEIKYDGCL